jgi:hypothetical protein
VLFYELFSRQILRRSNLIDRVRYSLLKSSREKLGQFAGAFDFKELTTLSFRLASPVLSRRDPSRAIDSMKHQESAGLAIKAAKTLSDQQEGDAK